MVILDYIKQSQNVKLVILAFFVFIFADIGLAAISVPTNIIFFVDCIVIAIFFVIWFFIEVDKR